MRRLEYGKPRLSGRALLEMLLGEREKALAGIHPKAQAQAHRAVKAEVEDLCAKVAALPAEEGA